MTVQANLKNKVSGLHMQKSRDFYAICLYERVYLCYYTS